MLKSKVGLVFIKLCYFGSRDQEQWWLSESNWSRQSMIPVARKILRENVVTALIVSPHGGNPGLLSQKYKFLRKFYYKILDA